MSGKNSESRSFIGSRFSHVVQEYNQNASTNSIIHAPTTTNDAVGNTQLLSLHTHAHNDDDT